MEAEDTADRYPSVRDVIDAVLNDPEFPEGDLDRLEIGMLATGEATWRAWEARSDLPVGGVFLTNS